MNTCDTCKHWGDDRVCELKEKLGEPMDVDLLADDILYCSYDEGGVISTGPKFGCIHHEPKDEPRDVTPGYTYMDDSDDMVIGRDLTPPA